jgi:hypothetical protein
MGGIGKEDGKYSIREVKCDGGANKNYGDQGK